VALALVLFFSLVTAISEQAGFNIAYLVSAISTIALISFFLRLLVKKARPVLLFTILLILLYGFIFILLSLNDYAFLAGNIGLFILLAVTMWISVRLRNAGDKQSHDPSEIG
jgi:inner membrane protein